MLAAKLRVQFKLTELKAAKVPNGYTTVKQLLYEGMPTQLATHQAN